MKTMIQNAKEQFKEFGHVRITHYFDRTYQNLENLVLSLEDAIDLIEKVAMSNSDEDLHVPHPNYF